MTIGQLLRGEADGAMKVIRRLIGRPSTKRAAVVLQRDVREDRILRLARLRVYGTDAWSLLDPGAVPDVMSK